MYFLSKDVIQPTETKPARAAWAKVSKLSQQLISAIQKADSRDDPLMTLSEIIRGFDFSPSEYQKQEAKELHLLLQRLADISGSQARGITRAIADRKGGRDRFREFLYWDVLALWSDLGGSLTTPVRTKTGGRVAIFFNAAVAPILGEEVALETLRDIVDRHRQRNLNPISWPAFIGDDIKQSQESNHALGGPKTKKKF